MRWIYIAGMIGIAGTLVADPWMEWEDYRLAANLSLGYLAIITTIFTARYIGWSRWRQNKIGQVFAVCTLLLSLVLLQGAVAVWWPSSQYPGKEYVRFVIYSGGVLGMAGMLFSLWRHQHGDRKEKFKWSSRSDHTDPT